MVAHTLATGRTTGGGEDVLRACEEQDVAFVPTSRWPPGCSGRACAPWAAAGHGAAAGLRLTDEDRAELEAF